jgi:glutathione-regulated potassium-efflux system ancillary protein KefF
MKTLVIASHPYPEQSSVIKALQETAAGLQDVTIRNVESLYGQNTNDFDVPAEQKAHERADRIVFLFPIHWFNLTPMLKAYLNAVWTYGWAFGPDGHALRGKEMLVVASAGASEHTYSHPGLIQSTLEEVLTPMKASALYVGMHYLPPLGFYEALGASDEKIGVYRQQLVAKLSA